MIAPMNILQVAIETEGGVGKLAAALGLRQNVVSNWRMRGLPKAWAQVLWLKYGAQPPTQQQQQPKGQGVANV